MDGCEGRSGREKKEIVYQGREEGLNDEAKGRGVLEWAEEGKKEGAWREQQGAREEEDQWKAMEGGGTEKIKEDWDESVAEMMSKGLM